MDSSINFKTISVVLLAFLTLSVAHTASADTVEAGGIPVSETTYCCAVPIATNEISNTRVDASSTQFDFAFITDYQAASASFSAYKFVFGSGGAFYSFAAVGPSSVLTPVSLLIDAGKIDINFPGLSVSLNFIPVASVPLPNSAWLLLSGLVGLTLLFGNFKGIGKVIRNGTSLSHLRGQAWV